MDDGHVEVLRVEIEERNENYEGSLEDEVIEEFVLPLPIIEDKTQHVISNMLDCEEVYEESNTAIMKIMQWWSMIDIKSSRPLSFLNLMPTRFCLKTGLYKLKIQSTTTLMMGCLHVPSYILYFLICYFLIFFYFNFFFLKNS